MKTYEKVYKLVKKIPKGKVATYGQIGQMLDLDPRVVGWALNRLAKGRQGDMGIGGEKKSPNPPVPHSPFPAAIPWQRVINSKGTISTNRAMNIPLGLQKSLLKKEGIKFDSKEKINLKKYLWGFTSHNSKAS